MHTNTHTFSKKGGREKKKRKVEEDELFWHLAEYFNRIKKKNSDICMQKYLFGTKQYERKWHIRQSLNVLQCYKSDTFERKKKSVIVIHCNTK